MHKLIQIGIFDAVRSRNWTNDSRGWVGANAVAGPVAPIRGGRDCRSAYTITTRSEGRALCWERRRSLLVGKKSFVPRN